MTHQDERSSEGAPDEMAAQDRWCAQRADMDRLLAEATELRRKVCPDTLTDAEGREWTWKVGDVYTLPMPWIRDGYVAAWSKSMIETHVDPTTGARLSPKEQ